MNRSAAQQAIDAAFADGIRKLFTVLVTGLEGKDRPEDIVGRFERGIHVHDEAHARATSAIDKIFPE